MLAVLMVVLAMLACAFGPHAISMSDIIAAVNGANAPAATILFDVRLPRTVAAALAGIALGASGAAMQGLLRNPLAEPGVMGVSASAATAATASVYFGLATIWPWVVPVASLGGALAATALIAGASFRLRGVASLILLGVAISALAGAVMALFVNLAPNPFSLSDLINWTAGSVANRDWSDVMLSLPFIVAGLLLLSLSARGLSAMALGEETAHGLGVDLLRHRLLVIGGTGLATGGAVALAGMIGFVGLIAPHMVRAAAGHDAGRALIPAALAGGCLLIVGDLAIRLFPWGNELHLGTLAALIGAPLFALIALRQGSVRHG
jgi:iron complex transport system permease protein